MLKTRDNDIMDVLMRQLWHLDARLERAKVGLADEVSLKEYTDELIKYRELQVLILKSEREGLRMVNKIKHLELISNN